MSPKKRKAKLLQIVEFHAEARHLAGNLSANQLRLIEVGIARGKELEPGGGWQVEEIDYFVVKETV
ncbi:MULTISPECIES: hypothetical protein [Pseudomonas]|uniref:Uncharacterized protein n=1 Tax=Pseudomonas izuensis TaxID=2684212 RepID=A0ABM7S7V5_9PSED|nr:MULTISPECIES: hypothetical protein [Pseudomonas]RKS20143.1 hypothetical protein BJ917_4037 [Pseudomonas sp. WPR_5_2]BCX71192.1 hypothetical protein LAB08_R58800 [Pseudomonas izuensis]